MMKKKQLFAALLSAGTLLSLVSCGGNTSGGISPEDIADLPDDAIYRGMVNANDAEALLASFGSVAFTCTSAYYGEMPYVSRGYLDADEHLYIDDYTYFHHTETEFYGRDHGVLFRSLLLDGADTALAPIDDACVVVYTTDGALESAERGEDTILLTVTSPYENASNGLTGDGRTVYTLSAEDLRVLESHAVVTAEIDGETVEALTTDYVFTYGEDAPVDETIESEAFGTEGHTREFTLITDPGTETEKSYSLTVGEKATAYAVNGNGRFTLYDDPEFTVLHEEDPDAVKEDATVYCGLMVPTVVADITYIMPYHDDNDPTLEMGLVQRPDGSLYVSITRAGENNDSYTWEMYADADSTNETTISYSGAVCHHTTGIVYEDLYTDGTGRFELQEDGSVKWFDDKENAGENCVLRASGELYSLANYQSIDDSEEPKTMSLYGSTTGEDVQWTMQVTGTPSWDDTVTDVWQMTFTVPADFGTDGNNVLEYKDGMYYRVTEHEDGGSEQTIEYSDGFGTLSLITDEDGVSCYEWQDLTEGYETHDIFYLSYFEQ